MRNAHNKYYLIPILVVQLFLSQVGFAEVIASTSVVETTPESSSDPSFYLNEKIKKFEEMCDPEELAKLANKEPGEPKTEIEVNCFAFAKELKEEIALYEENNSPSTHPETDCIEHIAGDGNNLEDLAQSIDEGEEKLSCSEEDADEYEKAHSKEFQCNMYRSLQQVGKIHSYIEGKVDNYLDSVRNDTNYPDNCLDESRSNCLNEIWNGLIGNMVSIGDSLWNLGKGIIDAFKNIEDTLASTWNGLHSGIKETASGLWTFIKNPIKWILDKVKALYNSMTNWAYNNPMCQKWEGPPNAEGSTCKEPFDPNKNCWTADERMNVTCSIIGTVTSEILFTVTAGAVSGVARGAAKVISASRLANKVRLAVNKTKPKGADGKKRKPGIVKSAIYIPAALLDKTKDRISKILQLEDSITMKAVRGATYVAAKPYMWLDNVYLYSNRSARRVLFREKIPNKLRGGRAFRGVSRHAGREALIHSQKRALLSNATGGPASSINPVRPPNRPTATTPEITTSGNGGQRAKGETPEAKPPQRDTSDPDNPNSGKRRDEEDDDDGKRRPDLIAAGIQGSSLAERLTRDDDEQSVDDEMNDLTTMLQEQGAITDGALNAEASASSINSLKDVREKYGRNGRLRGKQLKEMIGKKQRLYETTPKAQLLDSIQSATGLSRSDAETLYQQERSSINDAYNLTHGGGAKFSSQAGAIEDQIAALRNRIKQRRSAIAARAAAATGTATATHTGTGEATAYNTALSTITDHGSKTGTSTSYTTTGTSGITSGRSLASSLDEQSSLPAGDYEQYVTETGQETEATTALDGKGDADKLGAGEEGSETVGPEGKSLATQTETETETKTDTGLPAPSVMSLISKIIKVMDQEELTGDRSNIVTSWKGADDAKDWAQRNSIPQINNLKDGIDTAEVNLGLGEKLIAYRKVGAKELHLFLKNKDGKVVKINDSSLKGIVSELFE